MTRHPRRIAAATAITVLLALATHPSKAQINPTAQAQATGHGISQHQEPPVTININATTRHGTWEKLPLYWIQATQLHTLKAYLQAKRGARYEIQITNTTAHRLGLVIAVDGRNIISGDYSTLSPAERMYVVDPGETSTYSGWRTSADQVNRFYFTDAPDSYAAAFGDYSAMGVIAVATYREVIPRLPYAPAPGNRTQEAAPLGKPQSEPGTGFGEPEYSPTTKVKFSPDPNTQTKYLVKYEWRETLCKKGIIECPRQRNRMWDNQDHYAPYPPQKTQ